MFLNSFLDGANSVSYIFQATLTGYLIHSWSSKSHVIFHNKSFIFGCVWNTTSMSCFAKSSVFSFCSTALFHLKRPPGLFDPGFSCTMFSGVNAWNRSSSNNRTQIMYAVRRFLRHNGSWKYPRIVTNWTDKMCPLPQWWWSSHPTFLRNRRCHLSILLRRAFSLEWFLSSLLSTVQIRWVDRFDSPM